MPTLRSACKATRFGLRSTTSREFTGLVTIGAVVSRVARCTSQRQRPSRNEPRHRLITALLQSAQHTDMASIPFVKATACGNDFLIIDFAHAPDDISAFSRRICDRHNGSGRRWRGVGVARHRCRPCHTPAERRRLRGGDLGQRDALCRGVVLQPKPAEFGADSTGAGLKDCAN